MTERVKGCTIVFDRDIREDDVKSILKAFRMMKYVASVKPVLNTSESYFAEERARTAYRDKVYRAINEIFNPELNKFLD